jgi:uncharacterized protein YycO
MRTKIIFIGILLLFGYFGYTKFQYNNAHSTALQNGDIIFQTSTSSQSKAIQLATHSEYSHCGIIFKKGDELYVYEAVQPVKMTRFADWTSRGKDGKYVVKRLKNAKVILTQPTLAKMKEVGYKYIGKNYDLAFEWSDDKIYCSELVWKIYQKGAGIEISKTETLGDFDFSNEIVQKKLKERYGRNIPKDQIVVTPDAIFESDLLEIVQ